MHNPGKVAPRVAKLAGAAAVAVLVAFVGMLLVSSYRAQTALRSARLAELTHRIERQAELFHDFLVERRSDLVHVAGSREIATWFENQALGMSMEYGLRASLGEVEGLLGRLRTGYRVGNVPVYSRVVLTDRDGGVVTYHGEVPPAGSPGWDDWSRVEGPARLSFSREGTTPHVVISEPVAFRERPAGRLVAWVPVPPAFFRAVDEFGPGAAAALVIGQEYLYLPETGGRFLPRSVRLAPPRIPLGSPTVLRSEGPGEEGPLATIVPVGKTPFRLAAFVPVSEELDPNGLRLRLLRSAAVAALLLAAVFLVVLLFVRNSVLGARLEETTRRHREVDAKNLRLQEEIEDRRRAEEELRRSEASYAGLFDTVSDAIYVQAPEGTFLNVNEGAVRMYGYAREELLGKTPGFVAAPGRNDLAAALELVRRVFATGRPETFEFWGLRKSGEEFPKECVASRGEYFGRAVIIVTARDVTDRKRADAEIRRLNAELEERVRSRTAELEVANREMEAFTYSVSHDLRAPLRAIDGFSARLVASRASSLDEEGTRLLGVVRANAQKMARLIDDLLAFSRVGRSEVKRERVDMALLAREVAEEVLAAADGAGRVSLRVADLPPAQGDPALLRQVWQNLLSNAVKFSARVPSPAVEVEGETDGPFALYRVRDNGAGFDMAYASKLFGVFARLHDPREFDGVGVGLAIVQRVVTRLGGSVEAEGEVGKGATFTFRLPLPPPPA